MAANDSTLSVSELRRLLDYDPETGIFRWLEGPSNAIKAGTVAGAICTKGYRQIKIGGKSRMAHRLAWLHYYGSWPADQIDHINGVPDDNRISNLREATPSQNSQNRPVRSDSRSGFKGVRWSRERQRWITHMTIHGRRRCLGLFVELDDAVSALVEARKRHHKEFARHA